MKKKPQTEILPKEKKPFGKRLLEAGGDVLIFFVKLGAGFVKHMRKWWMCWLMMLPALLALALFRYAPMFGLVMAFQRLDYSKGIFGGDWIGFDNFKFLFQTSDAWIITRNTIVYNLVFIVLGLFLSITLALALNEIRQKHFAKVTQTIFIMPHFLSMVVVSLIVYGFLSAQQGVINNIITASGGNRINWYSNQGAWPFILVFVRMYCTVGFDSIIYMAVISSISQEYYEAACLDGASRLKQIFYVTLPQMRPIICINLIRALGHIMHGDFGLFYTVPRDSGTILDVTNVLDTYIYRAMLKINNPGMTTAAGMYQSVIGLLIVLLANFIIKKIDEDSAMF